MTTGLYLLVKIQIETRPSNSKNTDPIQSISKLSWEKSIERQMKNIL